MSGQSVGATVRDGTKEVGVRGESGGGGGGGTCLAQREMGW